MKDLGRNLSIGQSSILFPGSCGGGMVPKQAPVVAAEVPPHHFEDIDAVGDWLEAGHFVIVAGGDG